MALVLGLITDVHFGPEAFKDGRLRKMSHEAARLTRTFVRQMNERVRPDLVVNLGDVIEDQSAEADAEHYAEFLRIMSKLAAPMLHVAGNHDLVNLSEDDLRRLWQHEGPLHYSRDVNGVHLVVLATHETKDVDVRIDAEQLDWLRRDLRSAIGPCLVFVHHPASEMRLEGNRWFEKAPNICRVAERRELRSILEESGKVVGVFNGHAHWNHFDSIASIPYVTLQSLVENLDEDAPGRAAAAYAVITLDERRLVIDVHGETPVGYQIELPKR